MPNFDRTNPGRGGRGGGDIDRVRDATDIVRVVGEVVALKPKGREYVGLCPFHDDHKPSMGVVPAKQIFHCFVCGTGGNVFTFVQKFHKMEFREALEFLAQRAGIALTPFRGDATPEAGLSRADLLKACASATDFFRGVLAHPEHGRVGRAVIESRGIAPEMVTQFLVGAAPDRWDGLGLYAKSKGIAIKSLQEAGLIKARDGDSGTYDALRHRLIFPIQDQVGRVIAFGGRKLRDEDEPKYLNTPETRLFNKSATLYGLNHAARAIQRERTALITEGYTDVIACHQGGFTNAVATLGTALTREHAAMLRRMADRVVLLFDGDEAGQRAADRAVEVFFAENLDVAICALDKFTDAKDPDELLKREGGADIFRAALAGATDLLEYRFRRIRERLEGAGLAALTRGFEEEVERLVEMGLRRAAPARQRLIVKNLARLTGLDEDTILRSIPQGRPGRVRGTVEDDEQGRDAAADLPLIQTSVLTPAEHLLGCVLCDATLWGALAEGERDFVSPAAYRWPLLSRVAQSVVEIADDGGTPDLAGVLGRVDDPDIQAAAVGLASRVDAETGRSARLATHFAECLTRERQNRASLEIKPRGADQDMAVLMERVRERARMGADRRMLPRPG